MYLVKKILSRAPWLEVFFKTIYWKTKIGNFIVGSLKNKYSKETPPSVKGLQTFSFDDIISELVSQGVKEGDIMILHSSFTALLPAGKAPKEMIDAFMELLGVNGTLVMPAFPNYKEKPKGLSRITADLSSSIWKYNIKKTLPWTGLLPFILMRDPDSIRSKFPLNSLVAKGAKAKSMFKQELKQKNSTPCGPNSAWAFCAKQNAIVVGLGVDLVKSSTMIHVAEDCFEEQWPIQDWYRTRKFEIIDDSIKKTIEVRERQPKWSCNFAENCLAHDLSKEKILSSSTLGDLQISSYRSLQLLNYLESRRNSGYPYYLWRIIK